MLRKDYYLTLGVSRQESFRGIQQALQKLAKLYHPDRAGPEATRKFQDIREAYKTLSDPEKRELYSHQLKQDEISARSRPEPIFSRSRLIPRSEPMSVLRDFGTMRPSFEPLFERFVRNFTGKGIPKGERLEGLNVEVILSPEEAASGVTVPVGVPMFYTCPECGGSGHVWLFPCVDCNTQGIIEGEETVRVRIRPLAADRAIIEVPIYGLGIHNFYLRCHIRIWR